MNTPKGIRPRAVAKAVENAEQRTSYPLVLIFALVVLGIFVGGILSYRHYEARFRTGIEQGLSAIAELKVVQIAQWRRERLVNASFLRRTPYVARRTLDVLTHPASPATRQMFTAWLESVFAVGPYERALLLDEHLNVALVYPEGTSGVLSDVALRAAQQALSSRQVVVADLHRETEDGPVYLSLMVPLVVRRESIGDRVPAAGKGSSPEDRSAGLLVLQINAHKQFYPMVQLWPTPSRTAEALLVRRDGKDALFLSELRFHTNSALRLRMSLERTNTPAVKAALGQEGIVDGIDYRGVPVVAALRAIPNSPWSMVARMDLAEVYAPLRERLWLTVLLMGALLLGAGASVGLIWRQQHVRFYQERHEAAEALIASEVRYRRLFESAKDGILILEAETGMIVDVNPFLIEMLGFSHEQFLGKKVWELGFFKDIVGNQANFAELQHKEYIRYEDKALETAKGRRIEVEFVSNIYQVNHHKVVQCNIRDITERKWTEKQIRRLHEELQCHAAELEQRVQDRTAQLQAANKELEAFSYSVSHDLRAPLRAMDGFAGILTEDHAGRLDEEGLRVVAVIRREATRMGQLIDDLLALSRASREPMRSADIDMSSLARTIFDECAAGAADRKIRLTLNPLLPAQGKPSLIRQVLANLLSNAVKYTAPRAEAEIELGSRVEGNENIYWVKDNGVGFDPKYAGKLFGIFQRLHSEDQFEGTGVGLALVQRIVLRHGGRVWAEGKLNEGAVFYFTLPNERNDDDNPKGS